MITLAGGNGPNLAGFYPAHQPCPGDGPVAFSHAHPMNHLTVLVHLEPPVAHVSSSQRDVPESILKLLTWSETLLIPFPKIRRQAGWLHCGDHALAPLRRS